MPRSRFWAQITGVSALADATLSVSGWRSALARHLTPRKFESNFLKRPMLTHSKSECRQRRSRFPLTTLVHRGRSHSCRKQIRSTSRLLLRSHISTPRILRREVKAKYVVSNNSSKPVLIYHHSIQETTLPRSRRRMGRIRAPN